MDQQRTACIQVRQLSLCVEIDNTKRWLLEDINFDLDQGHCLGLVGESGSGKTLIAKTIMQLLPYNMFTSNTARVEFEEKNMLKLSDDSMCSIRGKRIGFIFQDAMAAFNPVKKIGAQIQEGFQHTSKLTRQQTNKKLITLLEDVGIKNPSRVIGSYPHQLSGGQLQRAMVAMSLAADPVCLIADEPTTSLDVTLQKKIIELLATLIKSRNISILFVSHDLALIKEICDDVVVLESGRVVEKNTCENFFKNPKHHYSKQLLNAILPLQTVKTKPKKTETLFNANAICSYYPIKKGFFKRTVGYVKAVQGISFSLSTGETLAVVGESGSGKTTLAKTLVGLLPIHAGKLNAPHVKDHNIAYIDLEMVFQDPYAALNPHMRIIDCLLEGILHKNEMKKLSEREVYASSLLTEVGLTEAFLYRYPNQCSGGQRQRICIARALACKPACIILDEPTSALDVSVQKRTLDLLKNLQLQFNISYILVTHNLSVVAYCADNVLVMRDGKVVEHGSTHSILNKPTHPYTKELLSALPEYYHIKNKQDASHYDPMD